MRANLNYKIKREILDDVLQASSNLDPLEFFAMLACSKQKGMIDEFVVVPAEYSRNSVLIKQWLIPFDRSIIGTIHSHPSGQSVPSHMDRQNFAKFGEIHLITFPPFSSQSFEVFDSQGRRTKIAVVD